MCLVAQSCPTLCDPLDYSLPGSSVHGIFQARILEWVAISFSRESSWPRDRTSVSCVSCIAGGLFTCLAIGKASVEGFYATEFWHYCWAVLCLVAQLCLTLCDPMACSLPGSSVHGDSPGKNTGVGCHALLQGIFPTQGLNPGLPHCRQILYWLNHQGSPRMLEWGAYPFSRWSFHPRNQTGVFCIPGEFFTSWATREAGTGYHVSVILFISKTLVLGEFGLYVYFFPSPQTYTLILS